MGSYSMTELLVPRDYQIEGARFLLKAKRAILADQMRVGKTGQAFLAWKEAGMSGPAMILARSNAQASWIAQAPLWGCQIPLIISGTQKQRDKDWKEIDHLSLVTTTVESFKIDLERGVTPRKWGFVVFDEAHRAINRKTQTYKTLKKIDSPYLFLLTGSPMRRGFQDLWSLLNICNRQQFSSYWSYLQTFGYMQLNEYGAWEILGLKEKEKLQDIIRPYFLRRTREDVAPELPPKQRILDTKLTLTKHQQRLYTDLRDEMVAELTDNSIIVAPTILAKITRLRQILCTPRLLDPTSSDWGAGLEYLGELLEDSDNDDHHFVIFTPFAQAIPIIKEYLASKAEGLAYSLQGGMKPEDVNTIINSFRESRGIMICTISYAESFDLFPASWCYFLGFSWDAAVENMQAEDRLQSMNAQNSVAYYYPTHRGCIDEELILEALNEKSTEILKVYKSNPSTLKRFLLQSTNNSNS